MEAQNHFAPIKKLLESASSFIVVLPPDPSGDLVAAGLSLHLALVASGKKSQIGCGSEIHVPPSLLGAGEIADSIGAKNLVISFDYHEDDLEKVDYDVRPDGKFYLMIKPKQGAPIPDVSNVKYSYSGASADLVITLGVNSFEELGKIYADEKSFLDEAKVLSLNIPPRPATFTQNLLHLTSIAFTELVARLLENTDLKPSPDAAKNLLTSLYEETKSLTSPKMTADTFSAIAFLMRHGARFPNQQAYIPRFSQAPTFFEAPHTPLSSDMEGEEEPASPAGGSQTTNMSDEDNIPLPTEENLSAAMNKPYVIPPSNLSDQEVPNDWTKPKIFRATDL